MNITPPISSRSRRFQRTPPHAWHGIHPPPRTTMPPKSATGAAKRARRKAAERAAQATVTHADAGEAIPGLPNHVVEAKILSCLFDIADFARLRAVSPAMREMVDELANGRRLSEPDMHFAAKVGNWLTIKRLHQQGHPRTDIEVCLAAAEGGRIDVLQWARAEGYAWDEWTCNASAWGGCLVARRYGDGGGVERATRGAAMGARERRSVADGGHLACLQWLREYGFPWDNTVCSMAAEGGYLAVLKWAHENGCLWDAWTCAKAAEGGQLEALQFAHENGCPWDADTCKFAAGDGHLQVLQYARKHGCPWNAGTCSVAAEFGHLKVLQWARANGCPWDELTCGSTALGGHLLVLKWLRANGCPWDWKTLYGARHNGHLKVMNWALENGAPTQIVV